MLATSALAEPVRTTPEDVCVPPVAPVVPLAPDVSGDELAPARGILLGMALGAVSLSSLGLLVWWAVG